ncbi:MAG: hypothetical protein ACR2LX_06875 [Jatrophihabitans sp.]
MQNLVVGGRQGELVGPGVARVSGPFASPKDAWRCARGFLGVDDAIDAPIEPIGEFVIPPPDGPPSRDFQTLHFDFGIPLAPVVPADVAP